MIDALARNPMREGGGCGFPLSDIRNMTLYEAHFHLSNSYLKMSPEDARAFVKEQAAKKAKKKKKVSK